MEMISAGMEEQPEQLQFAGFPAANAKPNSTRDHKGRFRRVGKGVPGVGAEVATIDKGEGFLAPLTIYEYPNLSKIIRYKTDGQGLGFYDTMLATDGDLAAFFQDLNDDVLHYPWIVRPASQEPKHAEQAAFVTFALKRITGLIDALRAVLDAHARGFSVIEKIYGVVDRGEWAGAVVYEGLLDKPQRWFTFDLKRRLRFRTVANIFPGELVDQRKFSVFSFGSNSNPFGVPILDFCYWPWFIKHFALEHQAKFFARWGSPTVVGEYKSTSSSGTEAEALNKRQLQRTLEVLMSIQNDNAVAIPEGVKAALLESSRNGTVSFEAYIDQLTKTESRIVTGQILTMMGDKGGSFALGKVHEKRESNKVDMLGFFLTDGINKHFVRDLVDRNFGPQDLYPRWEVMTRALLEKQGWLEVEQAAQANGHKMSKAWSDSFLQTVLPSGPDDILVPPPSTKPSQELPVSPTLSDRTRSVSLAYPPKALHDHARAKGKQKQAHLDSIGRKAVAKAKPAITRIVKHIGGKVKKAKSMKAVNKRAVYSHLKTVPISDLGSTFTTLLDAPAAAPATMAAGDQGQPPDIPVAAKLALALQMMAIADRIAGAADDAPDGTTPEDFANSLTDPNGVAIDQAFGNMFEGTHSTNIASIATEKLREQLADPKFRAANPYVMVVATNPEVRLSHKMLDGFVMTAEEARYSPFLPPFDFGCDCQAVPISAAMAKSLGLTGAAPTGTLEEFLLDKGATPSRGGNFKTPAGQEFYPGSPPGFSPAYSGTDTYVQLQAVRQKAEELRAEDPQAWAELQGWLLWLFLGLDILRDDPPVDESQNGTDGGLQ